MKHTKIKRTDTNTRTTERNKTINRRRSSALPQSAGLYFPVNEWNSRLIHELYWLINNICFCFFGGIRRTPLAMGQPIGDGRQYIHNKSADKSLDIVGNTSATSPLQVRNISWSCSGKCSLISETY